MKLSDALALALVVLTAVYAVLTWFMARESRKAAEASRDAARASEHAAQAAIRSATAAEAQLPVKFKAEVDRHRDGAVWFTVTSEINLLVHSARISCWVVVDEKRKELQPGEGELKPPMQASWTLPRFCHAGEEWCLEWPNPSMRKSDDGVMGFIWLEYSLAEDGPRRTRNIYVECPEDIGERLGSVLTLPPKMVEGAASDGVPDGGANGAAS